MKLVHIISSIDKSSGGPSKSVSELALHQAQLGVQIDIITLDSDNPYLRESPHTNLTIHLVQGSFKRTLLQVLRTTQIDLFHGHGLWQMPVHNMVNLAKKYNIPYIITPRGMLEPWALNHKAWKKQIAMHLYQKRDLQGAVILHATAEKEAERFRQLGYKNPIAIIPNGILLKDYQRKLITEKSDKTLLFLSRIHKVKGIENLIEAWSGINPRLKENWQVLIAGNGKIQYINKIQCLIENKELTKEIKIIGPQFGDKKKRVYQEANLFVLPTFTENFGIVVAEALAYGVPVITTKGAPWEDLVTYKAGWWVDIGVAPLKRALEEALQTPQKELEAMGLHGRKLVEQNYSIEQVAKRSIEMYQWILNERKKPDFIDVLKNV